MECVKITFQYIHHQQDTKSDSGKHSETKDTIYKRIHIQRSKHGFFPENCGKLRVSKRKSPKSKIRCGIRYHTEDEFDSFDTLVNKDLRKVVFFFLITTTVPM